MGYLKQLFVAYIMLLLAGVVIMLAWVTKELPSSLNISAGFIIGQALTGLILTVVQMRQEKRIRKQRAKIIDDLIWEKEEYLRVYQELYDNRKEQD